MGKYRYIPHANVTLSAHTGTRLAILEFIQHQAGPCPATSSLSSHQCECTKSQNVSKIPACSAASGVGMAQSPEMDPASCRKLTGSSTTHPRERLPHPTTHAVLLRQSHHRLPHLSVAPVMRTNPLLTPLQDCTPSVNRGYSPFPHCIAMTHTTHPSATQSLYSTVHGLTGHLIRAQPRSLAFPVKQASCSRPDQPSQIPHATPVPPAPLNYPPPTLLCT